MTNLRNVLDKLRANKAIASNLDKAQDAYAQKAYAEEWAEAYSTVERWHLLPSALSVAGASFAFTSVFPQLPWWLAICIGLPLSSGFEVLKGWVTKLGFRDYFKNAKFNALLAASIALYTCSVCISTWGAYKAFKLLEKDQVGLVEYNHQIAKDSIDSYYRNQVAIAHTQGSSHKDSLLVWHDERIASANEQLQAFEKQHDVKGEIAWTVRTTHGNLVERLNSLRDEKALIATNAADTNSKKIQKLEKEHKAAIEKLEAERPNIITAAKDDLGAYLWIVLAIALMVEGVIFAFKRFSEYYLYRSNQDVELISESQQLTIDLDTVAQLGQFMQMQSLSPMRFNQAIYGSTTSNSGSQPIGFKPSSKPQAPQEPEPPSNSQKATPPPNRKKDFEAASNPEGEQEPTPPDIPKYFEAPLKSRATKDTDYRKKYPELIADLHSLNKGSLEATTGELAAKHGISEGTVYRVKKALFI